MIALVPHCISAVVCADKNVTDSGTLHQLIPALASLLHSTTARILLERHIVAVELRESVQLLEAILVLLQSLAKGGSKILFPFWNCFFHLHSLPTFTFLERLLVENVSDRDTLVSSFIANALKPQSCAISWTSMLLVTSASESAIASAHLISCKKHLLAAFTVLLIESMQFLSICNERQVGYFWLTEKLIFMVSMI